MVIKVLKSPIKIAELSAIAREGFGDMVKAAVDIKQGIMAVGGEFHADEEALLMGQHRSEREFVWGVNLYPKKSGEEFIKFDSMINLKPAQGNRTRGVEDVAIQEKIEAVVQRLISE